METIRATEFVPPWIPASPKLLVVGQSPGRTEGERRIPFVGPAGQELRSLLAALGLNPTEDVAYANVDNYFHPDDQNHTPTKAERVQGYADLGGLAATSGVAAIVLLGLSAVRWLFVGRTMEAMNGQEMRLGALPVLAGYHPSWVIRARGPGEMARRRGILVAVLKRAADYALGREAGSELPTPTLVVGQIVVDTLAAVDVETRGERRADTADPRRATFDVAAVANHEVGVIAYRPPIIVPRTEVYVHNVPYDPVVLRTWDANWGDTKVLAWLLGEPDTTLKGLTIKHLGEYAMTYGGAEQMGEIPRYCLADAQHTYRLHRLLYSKLHPATRKLYDSLERPLLPLWSRMTLEGSFYLDRTGLQERAEWAASEYARLENDFLALTHGYGMRDALYCGRCGREKRDVEKGERCDGDSNHDWAGGECVPGALGVNVDSPTQLVSLLHEMGIPVGATDAATLRAWEREPVVQVLLDYRAVAKELGTYLNSWLTVPDGQRLGAVWRPTGTVTGRVSSARPNLQNVPNELEKFFRPEEGYQLVELDNAQLEVRIAAQISQDPVLMAACRDEDVHGTMMATLGLSDRRLTKVFVFGSLYADTEQVALASFRVQAAKFGITMDDATIREGYRLLRHKAGGHFAWAHEAADQPEQWGLFGRRHIIPGEGQHVRQQRINAPIQGGAGTVTKFQMLALDRAGFRVRRQVHDSVTLELPAHSFDDDVQNAIRIMETAVTLDVPIKVEAKGVGV